MFATRASPSCLALDQLSTPVAEENSSGDRWAPRDVGARGSPRGLRAGAGGEELLPGSRGCTAEDRVLTLYGLDRGGNVSLRAKSESEEPGSATSQVEHVSSGARKRQGSNTAGAPRLLAGSANGWGEVGKAMALARAKVPTRANLALLVPKFLPFFSFILPQVDCLESTVCVCMNAASHYHHPQGGKF